MNEIVKHQHAEPLRSLAEMQQIGITFYKSGLFTDIKSEAAAITKILAGAELGLKPFASLNGIYIVQGKVTVGANLMAQRVKESAKYDYRVLCNTDALCEIEFFEKGESLGISSFSIEDARKAGTQNLQKFPRNMLFARAMSNGIRWHCPDVFTTTVYTPEEMGEEVDGEGAMIAAREPAVLALAAVAPVEAEPVADGLATDHQRADYEKLSREAVELGLKQAKPFPVGFSEAAADSWLQKLRDAIKQQKQRDAEPKAHPLDDIAVPPSSDLLPTTPLSEAVDAKRAEATAKPLTSRQRAFFAKANELGLDTSDVGRPARMEALNAWLTANAFPAIQSTSELTAGTAPLVLERLGNEITWPSATVEGEVEAELVEAA